MLDPGTLRPRRASKFKRDVKRVKKRGLDPAELDRIIMRLARREPLEPRHKDHLLSSNWRGARECHIRPDWLLIYKIEDDTLILERTGSHSDLFG